MAWDIRNGKRYYYRSRRRGHQVVREYVGTGSIAEREAALDARRRVNEQAQREARRAEQNLVKEAETPALELVRLSDLILRATLVGSGFHQHDRGPWRKRKIRPHDK